MLFCCKKIQVWWYGKQQLLNEAQINKLNSNTAVCNSSRHLWMNGNIMTWRLSTTRAPTSPHQLCDDQSHDDEVSTTPADMMTMIQGRQKQSRFFNDCRDGLWNTFKSRRIQCLFNFGRDCRHHVCRKLHRSHDISRPGFKTEDRHDGNELLLFQLKMHPLNVPIEWRWFCRNANNTKRMHRLNYGQKTTRVATIPTWNISTKWAMSMKIFFAEMLTIPSEYTI